MIGSFEGRVIVELTPQRNKSRPIVKLMEDVGYLTPQGQKIIIPAGTLTDWGSVPRWLWPIFPHFDKAAKATLLHDFLLVESPRRMPRADIDRTFREAMRDLGVPQWRRNAMWLGVRLNAIIRGDK